jgi:hypothetical protein
MIEQPIITCKNESCYNCDIHSKVTCHLSFGQLLRFYVIVFPSFIIGGIGIYTFSVESFIIWVAIIALFFLIVGIRVLCTHCPHYNESSNIIKCWANFGVPKLWKYRPWPMNIREKAILICGFLIIWGYPVIFMLTLKHWIILGGYILSILVLFTLLKLYCCRKCLNFSCPMNGVAGTIKGKFLENNPLIFHAWTNHN